MATPNFSVGVFYTQDQIKLAGCRKLHQFLSQYVETIDHDELEKQLQIVKESMEETYNTHPLGQHRAVIMTMNRKQSPTYDKLLTVVDFLKKSGYNENLIYDYIFNLFLQYSSIEAEGTVPSIQDDQTESETIECQI